MSSAEGPNQASMRAGLAAIRSDFTRGVCRDPRSDQLHGRRLVEALRLIMKARLSAPAIEAYMDGFNRHAAELLPLHNMADVHKLLVDDFLAPLGLELEPHEFRAASGDKYVNFLLRPQALANYLVQDLGLAGQLMLEPPPQTRDADDPLRIYGEHVDALWFRNQQARLGPGVIILSMSAFMDGTVRKAGVAGGAHYFPVMYLNNNLPTRLRYQSQHVIYGGFACCVVTAPNDPRFQGKTPKQIDSWIKEERASCQTALLGQIMKAFFMARAGECVKVSGRVAPAVVVPMLGVYQLDHPQQMSYTCTKHCGFCTLGHQGVQGLAMCDADFKPRDASQLRKDVLVLDAAEGTIADQAAAQDAIRDAQRVAKLMKGKLRREAWKKDLTNVRVLLQDPHFNFLNVSVSPMHCQKGAYKDAILWTMEAVFESCQNKAHFQRLLRAWDAAAVSQSRAYLQGRCKSRGISGVLTASSIEGKLGVRSSSKADLANAMKILRALLFFVHSEAFHAHLDDDGSDGKSQEEGKEEGEGEAEGAGKT